MLKCNGCTERKVGCHSDCEDYLAYRKELEEEKARRQESRKEDNDYWSYRRAILRREARRH